MKKNRLLLILLACLMAFSVFAFAACAEDKPSTGGADVTISLNPTSLTLTEGSTAKGNITATVTGSSSNPNWSIDNPGVATIAFSGKMCQVTPVAEGTAVVTAEIGKAKATCAVTVSPAGAVETVSISDHTGAIVTESYTLERTDTEQFTAVASKGSTITWVSTDPSVASVSQTGLVKALKPGDTTIRAAVSSSIKAEFNLTVTAKAGDVIYDLKASDGNHSWNGSAFTDPAPSATEYYYWASFDYNWLQCVVTVNDAYYENGKIVIDYSGNDKSNGMQIHLKQSSSVTVGKYYKLTAKINTDTAGWVNINETAVQLTAGDNNVTVYYHAATADTQAFSMFMGKEGFSTVESELIKSARMEISEITWTEDTERVQLVNPTFNITSETEGSIIHFVDSANPAGSVKEYRLGFFLDTTEVTSVVVRDGEPVDISAVDSETYTVEIKVIGVNSHYINSEYSSTNTQLMVENATGRTYTLASSGGAGAYANPGAWTFAKEDWVYPIELTWLERDQFAPKFENSKVNAGFANNESTWYALQFFYHPTSATTGNYYMIKLTITLESDNLMVVSRGSATGVEGEGAIAGATTGWVTICGTPVEIEVGTHEYTVYAQAAANTALVSLVMGKDDPNGYNRISKANVKFGDPVVSSVTPENLDAPTFTWTEGTKTINISDTNATEKVSAYRVGFFAAGDTDNPSYHIDLDSKGQHTLNLATVGEGTYTIKVKAIGAGIIYADSEYAGNTPASTVTVAAQKLTAPTFTWNDSSKQITVGDAANAAGSVAKYVVGLFEDAQSEPTYTFDVAAKDVATTISLDKVFAGTYTIKVKAVGAGAAYPDSDWAVNTTPDTVTSTTESITIVAGPERSEAAAKDNPDEWYVWSDLGATASLTKTGLTVKHSATGGNWYGVQIFYRDSSIAAGTYTVTMNINVNVAGNYQINGQIKALVAGDNTVTINNYSYAAGACTINIQLGTESQGGLITNGGSEVIFTLKDVTYTAA